MKIRILTLFLIFWWFFPNPPRHCPPKEGSKRAQKHKVERYWPSEVM